MSFSSEGLRKCDARLLGELPPLLLVHLDLEKLRIIMVLKTERERVFQQFGEHKKLLESCERDFA